LLLTELELRMDLYNRLFHFDPAEIAAPLQVRAIADAEAYESYVSRQIGRAPAGAVYIHYSRPDKRELAVHRGSGAEPAMLAHQAFVQYLRAFVPNPPSWMRDGFAIVFSAIQFDPAAQELAYGENLAWLDAVKKLGPSAPEPEAILLADARGGGSTDFQPLAWALASFFLNYDTDEYFRTLAEMFMALSPDATAAENSLAAAKRLTVWTDFEALAEDYQNYLGLRKSYAELVEAGQRAYESGDREAARTNFAQALSARPGEPAPYYYLGLIAYDDRDFAKAGELYNAALGRGADDALVQYALGLNAAAAGQNAEARRLLEQAAIAAPERFGEKAHGIIGRLRE
jgi:hypothetical protein